MKCFSIVVLLFSSFYSFSQNAEKIKLFYSSGGSSWGNNRIFSKSEIFELTKNENNDFVFSKHQKINDKVRNQKITKDTIEVKNDSKSIISKEIIESLLTELNSNRENFTSAFLSQHFTKPTKKEIFKIAKKSNQKSLFANNYEEKTDFENRYLDIQNYKKLDDFVNSYKKDNEQLVFSDAWHFLRLFVYEKKEIKMYEFAFLQDFGQPISVYTVESINEKSNKVDLLYSSQTKITNFNVNLLLIKILPKQTMTTKILDFNRIRDKYISWSFENVDTKD